MQVPSSCSCWMKKLVQYGPGSLQWSRKPQKSFERKSKCHHTRTRHSIPSFTFERAHACTTYPITRIFLQTDSVNIRAGSPECFLYAATIQKHILLSWVAMVVTEHLAHTDKSSSQYSHLDVTSIQQTARLDCDYFSKVQKWKEAI